MVRFETSLGNFTIELFQKEAPIVGRRISCATSTRSTSTAPIFHRVIPGFVIQGGGLEPGLQPEEERASPSRTKRPTA